MKRIDLTPKQLEDVIRLRQSGLSWYRIHRATNISPKVAWRFYRQWEKARSIRELENVRVKVGEMEFEWHLDMLDRLAQNLVDHLSIPRPLRQQLANMKKIIRLYHLDIIPPLRNQVFSPKPGFFSSP